MAENGFYREKFFYVVLILCIGAWGWATFLFFTGGRVLAESTAEAREIREDMRKESNAKFERVIGRIETLRTEQLSVDAEQTKTLIEIMKDIKYIAEKVR